MIDGKPEFSDLVYDFIKSRYPSASKSAPHGKSYQTISSGIDIFIDGRWVCQVVSNKVYSYVYNGNDNSIKPTDPQLFDKLIYICGGKNK